MKKYTLEVTNQNIWLRDNRTGDVAYVINNLLTHIPLLTMWCFEHGISLLDVEDSYGIFKKHPREPRTKTMAELLEQWHRIAERLMLRDVLRHRAYGIFCRYRDAMDDNDRYWDMRQHVIRCINGDIPHRGYLCSEDIKLTEMQKATIAGRIADTTVRFTRQEYAGF